MYMYLYHFLFYKKIAPMVQNKCVCTKLKRSGPKKKIGICNPNRDELATFQIVTNLQRTRNAFAMKNCCEFVANVLRVRCTP
jgi:hypothetical protein